MKVHHILPLTKAEGPGTRFCLWVQGCAHGCDGCFAKDLWDYSGGYEVSKEDVIRQLQSVLDQIDGITFLGGEPMDQAADLYPIAAFAREHHKTVLTFSGYLFEDLLSSRDPAVHQLLSCTDLLADGPFMKDKLDYSRPLVGSSNQRFLYLTDAISEEELMQYHNRFEMRVDSHGLIRINGMGNIEKLQHYLERVNGSEHGKSIL